MTTDEPNTNAPANRTLAIAVPVRVDEQKKAQLLSGGPVIETALIQLVQVVDFYKEPA